MIAFPAFRRRIALMIAPELAASAQKNCITDHVEQSNRAALLTLADALAAHQGVTHFAISMRALGKGDFFKRLKDGYDCRTRTAARLMQWFSDNWPADLVWPRDIPRPPKQKEAA